MYFSACNGPKLKFGFRCLSSRDFFSWKFQKPLLSNDQQRSLASFANGRSREELLDLLKLKTFSEDEWKYSFRLLKKHQNTTAKPTTNDDANYLAPVPSSEKVDVKLGLENLYAASKDVSTLNPAQMAKLMVMERSIYGIKSSSNFPANTEVTYDEYKKLMTAMVEKLDSRILNIAFSFVLTGLSVGIIIPCMPLLVSQLQISPSAFGFVISAFGLSRLLGNIPSGYLVERYGRKPVISAGLMLCGLGNFAISLIFLPGLGASWLVLCRFLAGFGVSAFVAGGYMYISDISTHLNRTRTIAPVMASFSAGTALGPAIGGVLVDQIGLANTYAAVGACFGLIGIMSQLTMNETMKGIPDSNQPLDKPLTLKAKHSSETPTNQVSSKDLMSSFKVAYTSWRELLKIPRFKNLVMLNGSLWFALSGAQFTLLPLLLVTPQFNFTPFEIGSVFAYSSIVSFSVSQIVAYIADKFGKQQMVITGCGLLSASVLALPFTTSFAELLFVLTPLSAGATAMNAIPPALTGDLTSSEQRAQALSLLRTSADVGFLFGATFSGFLANQYSLMTAMGIDGAAIGAALIWYAAKSYRLSKQVDHMK